MKIIITESQNNLIRRVYSLIEEYIGELSPDDICTLKWRAIRKNELWKKKMSRKVLYVPAVNVINIL